VSSMEFLSEKNSSSIKILKNKGFYIYIIRVKGDINVIIAKFKKHGQIFNVPLVRSFFEKKSHKNKVYYYSIFKFKSIPNLEYLGFKTFKVGVRWY